MTEEKKKRKIGVLGRIVIIFIVLAIIGVFTGNSEETTQTNTNTRIVEETKTEEKTLQEHYNKHKNYIWLVCQEGLKLIDGGPYNLEGPTYAGEYMGKFIIKGTNNGILFRCEFIPYDNERGMNLEDVRYEI